MYISWFVKHLTAFHTIKSIGKICSLHLCTVTMCSKCEGKHWKEAVCLILLFTYSVAMTATGILDNNSCSGDNKLAVYMIVQGASSVFIPILTLCGYYPECSAECACWLCVIIGLFNVIWAGIGTYWIAHTPCTGTGVYGHAVGFTIPWWIVFIIFAMCYCYQKHCE